MCSPITLFPIRHQGSLTTGLGNRYNISPLDDSQTSTWFFRFVLASTQELHEKITQLANRVRQLEDGLRVSHAQVSPEQHPLLSDDLLKIKAPLQRDATNVKPVNVPAVVKEEENNPDAVDASGSLSIGQSGKTKFYGQTANSWVRILVNLPLLNLSDVTPMKSSFS